MEDSNAVGKIVGVYGLKVKAKLFSLMPPYLISYGHRETAPRINGFVKTLVGLDVIICRVAGEYSELQNGEVSGHYLDLEVIGYFEGTCFIQGLRILPIVSANVFPLLKEDYDSLYGQECAEALPIGNSLFDEARQVTVDVNKLIPSHIGVFGNTGSGKSNTLAKLLSEYSSCIEKHETNRGKFIVIDINNEYGGDSICDVDKKTIYELSTGAKGSERKIPLDLKKMTEDDFVVLLDASQKTQVPAVKKAFQAFIDPAKDPARFVDTISGMISNSKSGLFYSIRYRLGKYFTGLDSFRFNAKLSTFFVENAGGTFSYPGQPEFQDKLRDISVNNALSRDPLDEFLFELYFSVLKESENGVFLDFLMPLLSRAEKLFGNFRKIFDLTGDFGKIFDGKSVCVIQLGMTNKDMKEIIPAVIANCVFERLAKEREENGIRQVINLVVDEAHTILYDAGSGGSSHEMTLETYEKVVKEGRKFGLFLMVASQRPSDISSTIISQLHNYFIHKLVNPSDIQCIRKAVAYMDEQSLDLITILAPGECIASGTAFQMPLFMKVKQVEPKKRPNSENIKLVGKDGLFEKKRMQIDVLGENDMPNGTTDG